MDYQWLANFLLELGLGITALRIALSLKKRQDAADAKIDEHEVRIIVLERAA